MTLTNKLILIVSGIVLFGALGFIIYQQYEMHQMTKQINSSVIAQKQLADQLVRSQANYVSKDDLTTFAKQNDINLNDLKNDLTSLGATVTGINNIVVKSVGQIQTNVGSTSTTPDANKTTPTVDCNGTQIPCPNADPFGYMNNVQHFELTEPFAGANIPIGNVSFDASNPKPWSDTIYPRSYSVSNILATTSDGRHVMYNKMIITSNGKQYPITIQNAAFEETYPTASFSFWNPRLMLFVSGVANLTHPAAGATLGMGLQVMSYGQTLVSPAISILQVGGGYETDTQNASIILNPISFNVGGILPRGIIDSSFLGPTLHYDVKGNVFAGVHLSVGF